MNAMEAKGWWSVARGKIKQRLARLTHDEHGFMAGKEEELIGRIQQRTGQRNRKADRPKAQNA